MITFLDKNKTSSNIIKKLEEFIEKEEYETDSIQIDIEQIGNIAIQMQDDKIIINIKQFIQSHKSMYLYSMKFKYFFNTIWLICSRFS